MDRQLIVTRPAAEGVEWVSALNQAGIPALQLPLIEIRSLAEAPTLHLSWLQSAPSSALMFVSPAAVRQCFALTLPDGGLGGWLGRGRSRVWLTGPGSASELLRYGVPEQRVDMPAADADEFDSEALWRVVFSQVAASFRLLIVRGRDVPGGQQGRPWLADQVRRAGAEVCEDVVYERLQPDWGQAQNEQARRFCLDGSIWLFSSSQAVNNLLGLLPGQDWTRARAVATHRRIAATARQAGFGVVVESRPKLEAVIASIKSSDEFGESPATA